MDFEEHDYCTCAVSGSTAPCGFCSRQIDDDIATDTVLLLDSAKYLTETGRDTAGQQMRLASYKLDRQAALIAKYEAALGYYAQMKLKCSAEFCDGGERARNALKEGDSK